MTRTTSIALILAACAVASLPANAGETFGLAESDQMAIYHAQGAQIYECRPETDGELRWKFREPIASLFEQGRTVGRHYAGPSWEFEDGSVVQAKVIAQAPPETAGSIPQLMLSVTTSSGTSIALAKTILRLNTKGGVAPKACSVAGEFLSVPYSADYAFYISSHQN